MLPTNTFSEPRTYTFEGHVQKGPFLSGSAVEVAELDDAFAQTGRTFSTNILDDTGAFRLDGVVLGTPWARVAADGFYFDEVAGELSASPLHLVTYVEVTDLDAVNVNPLGHLESGRIAELIRAGASFADARSQVHEEVLALFGFDDGDVPDAERLDVAADGVGNAKLLALSVILQGHRSVAELTELLSAVQTDIRTDGTLDSDTTGSAMMNAAVLVDVEAVRSHLEARYADLGIDAVIPDFESQIAAFRENTDHAFTAHVTYPDEGAYGTNVLALNEVWFASDTGGTSFAADVPEGMDVRVVLTGDQPLDSENGWGMVSGSAEGWSVGSHEGGDQEFTSTRSGRIDMNFSFWGNGTATVDYYEFGEQTPTHTKVVTWESAYTE